MPDEYYLEVNNPIHEKRKDILYPWLNCNEMCKKGDQCKYSEECPDFEVDDNGNEL